MDIKSIKQVLIDQNKLKKNRPLGFVGRKLFDEIQAFKEAKQIMIISGIRRCGKSTLLQHIRESAGASYFVNFDDERFVNFTVENFQSLYEVLIELFGEREVFFFDEIQDIPNWERFVRRLFDQQKKIYITGSNASMLSKELGTHLTGRHISFTLYPFSFQEFLDSKGLKVSDMFTTLEKGLLKKSLNEYLEFGGMPEYLELKKTEYLKSIFENILYRDILARYKLTSDKAIKEMAVYAASNVGKEISYNKIKNMVGLSNARTVKEYFSYMNNSYLLFLLSKYDASLKVQNYANKKIYLIDPAMIKVLGFRTSEDRGRIFENIVYLELIRSSKEVFYHQGKKECDFVVRSGSTIVEAIQVSLHMNDEKTKKREFDGLLEAMDRYKLYEGLIITEDDEFDEGVGEKHIRVVPLWKWLLA